MSSEGWKLEKDLCRCCHGEGAFQNLAEPRYNLGQQEIYSDMLQYCLNIEVTPMTGVLCAMTYTICDSCILRLRDAFNFKKQVLLCEERFKDMYSNVMKALTPNYGVKQEPCTLVIEDIKEELPQMDSDVDVSFDPTFDDDDDDEDDNKTMLQIKQEDARKSKAKAKAKPKPKPKKAPKKIARPKKKATQHTDDDVLAKEDEPKLEKGSPQVDDYVIETNNHKKYACKACKIAYRRISDLRNHVTRTHLKQKFIKCRQCPETFMYHAQRKEHMYTSHSVQKPEEFVCGECNRAFKRKNTLAEHMMDVHVEKKCDHCGLKFVRRKFLFHMNEFHGTPMPTCGVCGLRTLKESALVRHQRNVHLNERNKKCNVCEKSFYTQSNLQDHMITHNQLRVFKCDLCDKSFARKECYKTHYRIHSGEKPFVCEFCTVAFVQRASLRFHLRSHHPNK